MNIEEVDPKLIEQLRNMGDTWGPLGVALAASLLTDKKVLIRELMENKKLMESPCYEDGEDGEGADNTLRREIERIINCYSAENGSDIPDFILAEYLMDCLQAFFDKAVRMRTAWYDNSFACDGDVEDCGSDGWDECPVVEYDRKTL